MADRSDLLQFLEANLARQLSWISMADSKTSFVFAVNTAMLAVLAAVSPKSASDWTVVQAVFAALAAALAMASLIFLSIASFPRTRGPKSSLIYFGCIAQRDANQFAEAASEMSEDAYVSDLCAQCHRNAEIAKLKFVWVQRALISLYLSVIPWCIAVYLLHRFGA